MSALSSRRPSLTSLSVASPTISTTSTPAISPTRTPHPQRRNRTALRDYYNLKAAAPVGASNGAQNEDGGEVRESELGELDREGFDAEGYVRRVLREKGLEGVLRVEGGLVGEIKGLDGERKALVYDNYSKLITATDTIRRMRMNMDPLTPTTSTLSPAVAHIAETARLLAGSLQEGKGQGGAVKKMKGDEVDKEKKAQWDSVRWVLATPKRLQKTLEEGKREEAESDWDEVSRLLETWEEVKGVEELKGQCLKIMERNYSDGDS